MEKKLDRRSYLFLIAALALAGCDRPAAKKAAPPPSYVRIAKLSPEVTTALTVGQKVRLEVEVEYALTTADTGTVALVVQSADNKSLASNMEVVSKGLGKAAFKAEFIVPETSAVQVFTPLQAQGQTSTATVAVRTYKVQK